MKELFEKKPFGYTYRLVCVAILALFTIISSFYEDYHHIQVTVTDGENVEKIDYYNEVRVDEVFADLGITLSSNDTINYSLDTLITKDTVLDIIRDGQTKIPVEFSLNLGEFMFDSGYREYLSIREEEEREAERKRQEQLAHSYTYIGYVGGDYTFNDDGTITTSSGTYELLETLTVNASAYCPCEICCEEYANGYTADGSKATAGYTLAAPSIYDFGTLFYIPYFDRVFEVEDRGGAIQDNRIDIYFDTHHEALQFGRQHITIYRIK